MEFTQLLNQISNLEGAQRQDKARIAEKEAKSVTLSEELDEVRKQLNEKTESLRSEKEKNSQLEVANRNHEKIQKQLKNALKSSKDESTNLSDVLKKSQEQSKNDSMVYLQHLEDINGKYRDLHEYFETQSVHQKLRDALDKAKHLEDQLIDKDHKKAPPSVSEDDQNSNPSLDILRSENEDLQQRLNEAVEENGNLQKALAQLEAYTNEVETKLAESRNFFQNLVCPYCGEKVEEGEASSQIEGERPQVDVSMNDAKQEEQQAA